MELFDLLVDHVNGRVDGGRGKALEVGIESGVNA